MMFVVMRGVKDVVFVIVMVSGMCLFISVPD